MRDRILTTHTGSLPRPDDLAQLLFDREDHKVAPGFESRVEDAVREVVEQQVAVGLDVINDGEQGKSSYAGYVKERLTGFGGQADGMIPSDLLAHPDYGQRMATLMSSIRLLQPACTGEVRLQDPDAVHRDISHLKHAVDGAQPTDLFMTAASPGLIAQFFPNQHYATHQAYLAALADAMRPEYQAIADAGIILQLDCPDLAAGGNVMGPDLNLPEFRRHAMLAVEALNDAVRDIPSHRLRMHLCWGNYESPHDTDIELKDIIDIVLSAKPDGIVLEACNPRHGHEWEVFETVTLPDDKYLVAGVIDSTNNYVEHPRLVSQRLLRYARLVGRERVMAGSDCGFGTFAGMSTVVPSVAWAKLQSLVEGARIASASL